MTFSGAPLALVFLLAASSAQAHCYSRWYYPWPQPQSCRTTSAPASRWTRFVEIPTPPPAPAVVADDLDDPARARAITALEQELRLRSMQTLELQTISLTMKEKRNGH